MKFFNIALVLMSTLASVDPAWAISHFDRKTSGGVRIYDLLLKQDVPEKALRRVFEFLDVNADKTVILKDRNRDGRKIVLESEKMVIHDDYATIIDYSKPSNVPRLYLMNLNTGNVEKYLVAHGQNSGALIPTAFSNVDESKRSSLGLYVGGEIYRGKHGRSLQLHGLEPSNSNAMFRDIVIHSADYVSYDFIKTHGRLGRSWGCPAVSPGVISRVLATMKNGSVIYGYHKDLMTSTLKNPSLQVVSAPTEDKTENRALPGEEGDVTKKADSVTKPATTEKAETKPSEAKPAETKATEAKTTEAKTTDAKATDVKATDAKPAEAKTSEPALTTPLKDQKKVATPALTKVTESKPVKSPSKAPAKPVAKTAPAQTEPSLWDRLFKK